MCEIARSQIQPPVPQGYQWQKNLILFLALSLSPPAFASDRFCVANLFCLEESEAGAHYKVIFESLTNKQLTMHFSGRQSGLGGPEQIDKHFVVEHSTKREVFSFPIEQPQNWSIELQPEYHIGSTTAEHDLYSYYYRIPFESGQRVEIIQAYDGGYTHLGAQRFAIDFGVSAGTKVVAARGGKVIGVRQDSSNGGPERQYKGQENYIWIQHDDGTIGQYLHLKRDGALVSEGQRVNEGDPIGLVGNTGYSREPHLHFHVSTSLPAGQGGAYKTFATFFKTANGRKFLQVNETHVVP